MKIENLDDAVPTLDGEVALKIPAETQSGKALRCRGKGVKSVRSGAVGDLVCYVFVETPVNLTDEQKKILEQLEQSLNKNPDKHRPKNKSWFDTVRDFFQG